MARRGRFSAPERQGPRYYCFRCQTAIDSPIQACPKHEPELHARLSDSRKKRDRLSRDARDARGAEGKPDKAKHAPAKKKEESAEAKEK